MPDSHLPTVAVVGSQGQLGAELMRQLNGRVISLGREQLDITRPRDVLETLTRLAPAVVWNAAAYTAVDRAETERDACYAVNARGVEHLAAACRRLDCLLVQISTDYVFGADRSRSTPYREDDSPGPQSVYAQSKLAGELAAATCPRHFIVRTCGLYGRRIESAQRNFVDTMLALAADRPAVRVVHDQRCTPSYVPEVARAVRLLAGTTAYGTYHVTNAGAASWQEFAEEIFRQAGLATLVEPITSAQFGAAAPRPAYSVLDNGKFHALASSGLSPLPHWRDSLRDYLAGIGRLAGDSGGN